MFRLKLDLLENIYILVKIFCSLSELIIVSSWLDIQSIAAFVFKEKILRN